MSENTNPRVDCFTREEVSAVYCVIINKYKEKFVILQAKGII